MEFWQARFCSRRLEQQGSRIPGFQGSSGIQKSVIEGRSGDRRGNLGLLSFDKLRMTVGKGELLHAESLLIKEGR